MSELPGCFLKEEEGESHKDVDAIQIGVPLPVQKTIDEEIEAMTLFNTTSRKKWSVEINYDEVVERFNEIILNSPIQFDFELDLFQKQAIVALEKQMNVFVSAHTSAGKTVVAEYAIAMAMALGKRVFYTSPIKALSNQKFRDFRNKFQNVGLLTGDTEMNTDAGCLVMTTEIFQLMLYKQSEIQNLSFVIFDEVQYINNQERGHVWEEALILLPPSTQIIMLSATFPNIMEFAEWVGQTKQRQIAVCKTLKRPVPLQHYVCRKTMFDGRVMKNKQTLVLIKDGDSPLSLSNLLEHDWAIAKMTNSKRQFRSLKKAPRASTRALIKYLGRLNQLPAVVFNFSRKTCDLLAESLSKIKRLTSKREKIEVDKYINEIMKQLSPEDQYIQQVQNISQFLKKGVGLHHSGVLPILKEVVEVLFTNGIVKVLVATETFAIGVNMPTKTVVFQQMEKYDPDLGQSRVLLPDEYIQMAGRAGRRGIDTSGMVVIIHPESDTMYEDLEKVFSEPLNNLRSNFKLSYPMIFMTLKGEQEVSVKSLISNSFRENNEYYLNHQYKLTLLRLNKDEKEHYQELMKVPVNLRGNLLKFFKTAWKYCTLWDLIRPCMLNNIVLTRGLFIIIQYENYINVPAIIIRTISQKIFRVVVLGIKKESLSYYTRRFEFLSQEEKNRWYQFLAIFPGLIKLSDTDQSFYCITIETKNIVGIIQSECLHLKDKLLWGTIEKELRNMQLCSRAFKTAPLPSETLTYLLTRLNYFYMNIVQCWDEMATLKANQNHPLKKDISHLLSLCEQLIVVRPLLCPRVLETIELMLRLRIIKDIKNKTQQIMQDESPTLYSEYLRKRRVLLELGYIDKEDYLLLKGRLASCIPKFELLVTELLMANIFYKSDAAEVAAVLSCLAFDGKGSNDKNPKMNEFLTPKLQLLIKEVKKIRDQIRACEARHQVDIDRQDKINFNLVGPIYLWAKGGTLNEVIAAVTGQDIMPGLLVKTIQKLREKLKTIQSAARLLGDPSVMTQLKEAEDVIARGMITYQSIYTIDPSNIDDQDI